MRLETVVVCGEGEIQRERGEQWEEVQGIVAKVFQQGGNVDEDTAVASSSAVQHVDLCGDAVPLSSSDSAG